MKVSQVLVLLVLMALPPVVTAQSVPYDITIVDIPHPLNPTGAALRPIDINNRGELLSNAFFQNQSRAVITYWNGARLKTTSFNCSDDPTSFAAITATSINNKGQIVGQCALVGSGPRTLYGFVRNRDGSKVLLHVPEPPQDNANTFARGINNDGVVIGQFTGPIEPGRGGALAYRFHCFIWDPTDGSYTQLDFPRTNTFIDCHAITDRGKVLGRYIEVTTSNETIEQGWFVYDIKRGAFLLDFPLSFEHIGGPGIQLADINNRGDIIGTRFNGQPGDGWNGPFLYRKGTFYNLNLPFAGTVIDIGVSGLNNKGQIVGTYTEWLGTDERGFLITARHGYVATPRFPAFFEGDE